MSLDDRLRSSSEMCNTPKNVDRRLQMLGVQSSPESFLSSREEEQTASDRSAEETLDPFAASEFSSSTVFRNCLAKIAGLELELAQQKSSCSIDACTAIGAIERTLEDITTTLKKLQRRDILVVGYNGIGKSFLLNLLFLMTCVDCKTYSSETEQSEFNNVRKSLHSTKLAELKGPLQPTVVQDANTSEDPVVHVLDYPPNELVGIALGLEALRGHIGKLNIVAENPIERWKSEGDEGLKFANKFEHEQHKDHEYLLARYTGYCETLQLKEENREKDFPAFLLPSKEEGQANTFFTCKNSFGCTFHLCVCFLTEDEILSRARDWIEVVALSIRQGNSRLKEKDEYVTLRSRFNVLFPTLKDRVWNESNAENLPKRAQLKTALHPEAQRLARQTMHVYAGNGKDFHRDRLFISKTFADEIGVGTKESDGAPERWVKRWMLKEISCFVPSRVLASGCRIVDSPGTGDRGYLPRSVIRNALEEHDVVLAVCPRSLAEASPTIEAIFDNVSDMPKHGQFSFPSRTLQDSSGKSLVVLHYWEQADKEIGNSREILRGEIQLLGAQTRKAHSEKQLEENFDQVRRRMKNKMPHLTIANQDIPSLVKECTTSFSAFPVLYTSLLLNAKFRNGLKQNLMQKWHLEGLSQENCDKKMQDIIDCTEGHTFFALPEILEQKHCRQKLGDLLHRLNEFRCQQRSGGGIVKFSNGTKSGIQQIMKYSSVTNAKTEMGRSVVTLLETIAQWDQTLDSSPRLKNGRRIEVLWRDGTWWEATVKEISLQSQNKWVEVTYLDKYGNHSGDQERIPLAMNGKRIWSSDRIKAIKGQDKKFNIVTALSRFDKSQSDEGIIKRTVDEYFGDFMADENMDALTAQINDSLKAVLDKLKEDACDDDDLDEKTLAIFSESGTFGSMVDLENEILAPIVHPLCSAFDVTQQQKTDGPFDSFRLMLYELRELIAEYSDFMGNILKEVIFDILLKQSDDGTKNRLRDHKNMENMYEKYIEVGSRSLHQKIRSAFALDNGLGTSKFPDVDFLSRSLRHAVRKEVDKSLAKINSRDSPDAKFASFQDRIKPILLQSFSIVKDELIHKFRVKIKDLKNEINGPKPFDRFTYRFLFDFVNRLHVGLESSRPDEKFQEAIDKWHNGVQETLEGLPRDEDIGSDITSNMIFLKTQQDIFARMKNCENDRLTLLLPESCICNATEKIALDEKFCERSTNIIRRFQPLELSPGTETELGKKLTPMGLKISVDPDQSKNTLWRALATQFVHNSAEDLSAIQTRLKLEVADQILCWCCVGNRRKQIRSLIGMSAEELVTRLVDGNESEASPDDELYLHFFLLRFCRPSSIHGETAANIWIAEHPHEPKYQFFHPHTAPQDSYQDGLFESTKQAARTINIALLSSSSCTGRQSGCFKYVGLILQNTKTSSQSCVSSSDSATGQGHQPPHARRHNVVLNTKIWDESIEVEEWACTNELLASSVNTVRNRTLEARGDNISAGDAVDSTAQSLSCQTVLSITTSTTLVKSKNNDSELSKRKAEAHLECAQRTKGPTTKLRPNITATEDKSTATLSKPALWQSLAVGIHMLSETEKSVQKKTIQVGVPNTSVNAGIGQRRDLPGQAERQIGPRSIARSHKNSTLDGCISSVRGSFGTSFVFVFGADTLYLLQERSRASKKTFSQILLQMEDKIERPMIVVIPHRVFQHIRMRSDQCGLPPGSLTPSDRTRALTYSLLLKAIEDLKDLENRKIFVLLQDPDHCSQSNVAVGLLETELADSTFKCAEKIAERHGVRSNVGIENTGYQFLYKQTGSNYPKLFSIFDCHSLLRYLSS